MNRLERIDDTDAALLLVLRGWQAGLYTSTPAIIESFDAAKQTCSARVAIKARVDDADAWAKVKQPGDVSPWVTLPKLVDVPVHFPGGGGYTLTFPVQAGDEALIVFAQRCIDNWFIAGGTQSQADLRMHDLSDGFAFVGIRSQKRLLAGGVSTSAAQLRSDDGATFVEVASGTVHIKAANLVIDGNTDINGTLKNNGVNVGSTHTHGGVAPGGANTAGPQ